MRRAPIFAGVAIAAVFALAHAGAAAEPIKISYANVNANFAPTFAAEDKGYFKEEGLDVQLVAAPGGTATPALIAGSLQYSSSTSSAMGAILKGAELTVVFVGTSRALYELWSFDPAVKSFAEMKGKTIPIMARGGTEEIAMRVYLKQKGLPADYLSFTPLGSGPVRLAALIGGTQHYAMLTSGEKGPLRQAGMLDKGRVLVEFAKEIETQNGGLVTSSRQLAEHRGEIKKILRALWKGTLYMQTQKEGMADILLKRLPKSSRETLLADLEAAIEDVDPDGEMPIEAAAKELAVRGEIAGVAPDKIPPTARVYDFSLIREVVAELKGWKPAR